MWRQGGEVTRNCHISLAESEIPDPKSFSLHSSPRFSICESQLLKANRLASRIFEIFSRFGAFFPDLYTTAHRLPSSQGGAGGASRDFASDAGDCRWYINPLAEKFRNITTD